MIKTNAKGLKLYSKPSKQALPKYECLQLVELLHI
jgi:hypothetical protein